MVMMGQQLMDSERKKEDDDDYVIKPHREQTEQPRSPEKMKRREVPTLLSLAKKSVGDRATTNGIPHEEKPKRKSDVVRIGGSGDGPKEQQPHHSEAINGESSSGRTSSLGGEGESSGIGSSLTSSSSSEPIERDALSPSSDDQGVNGDSAEDVPENGGIEGISNANIDMGNSQQCQALLLTEEYDGQMTAAKRFLQMVRDGIKSDDDGNVTPITATPSRSGIPKGPSALDSTTDDEETKSVILKNNNSSTINLNKEKIPGVRSTSKSSATQQSTQLPTLNGNIQSASEKGPQPSCVQEVWAHNMLVEFSKIRKIVKTYTFIAMDTEFPGIVVRPQCAVRSGGGVFPYELLKSNVDRLKIIQLGVTFMDKAGNTPPGVCTWQFNFKFSLNKDIYAPDSISLLTRCGIQFERHAEMGIDPEVFGEYFMSSGMVTSESVTYLTFHSGFDFGYLIKLLSNLPLPENEEKFFDIMRIYFPNVYDLKFLMKSVDLHGGLQDIANQMGQERVGTQHQAGSDSLLTGMTFFKLLHTGVFNGELDETKYCGKLYGFHMTAEDGRDEGWSEIPGAVLDPTSPKPQNVRSSNTNGNGSYSTTTNGNNAVLLPPSAGSSTNIVNGDTNIR